MRVWVAGSRSIWCGGTKSSYTRSLEATDHPLLASLLPPDSEMVDERELKKKSKESLGEEYARDSSFIELMRTWKIALMVR